MKELLKGYENNPSARAIILKAREKAKKEKYGGYWTRRLEELTGLIGDRGAEDTGMEMEHHYQE